MADEKKIILLAEDTADDEELTRRALKKHRLLDGNELVVVRDGAEALEYLAKAPRLPAVMLLDLKMPKVDGIEVLRRVRAEKKTEFLPVVVLTSSQEEQDLIRSYSLGANGYIRKPLDIAQFREATRNLGLSG